MRYILIGFLLVIVLIALYVNYAIKDIYTSRSLDALTCKKEIVCEENSQMEVIADNYKLTNSGKSIYSKKSNKVWELSNCNGVSKLYE